MVREDSSSSEQINNAIHRRGWGDWGLQSGRVSEASKARVKLDGSLLGWRSVFVGQCGGAVNIKEGQLNIKQLTSEGHDVPDAGMAVSLRHRTKTGTPKSAD